MQYGLARYGSVRDSEWVCPSTFPRYSFSPTRKEILFHRLAPPFAVPADTTLCLLHEGALFEPLAFWLS